MKPLLLTLLLLLVLPTRLLADEYPDLPWTTIVDEDFSGITEGTEDNPGKTSLLDEMGWFIDESVLHPITVNCTYSWGGDQIYPAGGCIALLNGGFINTPTCNYSGNLKLTFRARLMKKDPELRHSIDILLCRRSALIDFQRTAITLTKEWQEFTFEATNGSFSDCMIQFFNPDNTSFLLDDIRIIHQITSIEPPKATDAYELEDDGFTAYWNNTSDATEYLLSVYQKIQNPDGEEVSEGFDALQVHADGTLDAASLPAGWTTDADQVSTASCASAPYSLMLTDDGQSVTMPYSEVALSNFSFWARVEDNGQKGKATGYVNLYALTDSGWYLWVYFSVEKSRGQGGVTDVSDALAAFDHVYQIRIEYENPNHDLCQVLIDDIHYVAPGTFFREFVFEDKVIPAGQEDPSCEVYGLDPDTDYFYYVKARNEYFTSEPSNEVEVFDVSNPQSLPATDVTPDSYVAHWSCHNKVDYFRIDQMRIREVTADTDDYVILDEDFSGVHSKGTAESPEYGEPTTDYYSIDEYTHTGGWTASSPQFGEGMIGGMYKVDGYIAGCIGTPVLDLSHNGGVAKFYIRAWAYEGDWLVVQGNNTLNYAGISFDETGWVETTLEMPLCTDEERFYIYSNSYYPFMIDQITVMQDMKKGEKVSLIDKSIYTEADVRQCKVEHVDFAQYPLAQYKVVAFRRYHGSEKNIWESPYSELVTVSYEGSALDAVALDGGTLGRRYDLQGRPVSRPRGLTIQQGKLSFCK